MRCSFLTKLLLRLNPRDIQLPKQRNHMRALELHPLFDIIKRTIIDLPVVLLLLLKIRCEN